MPLTQGYWKNHQEDWMTVLQTTPKGGNAYYLLAHQYIATVLNMYSGSWAPYDKIEEARLLFADQENTPKKIGALKGDDPTRQQFINLAAYLDDYNNRRLTE